jgi:hypothetical protein
MAAGAYSSAVTSDDEVLDSVSKRWPPAYSSVASSVFCFLQCIEAMAAGLPVLRQQHHFKQLVYRSDGCRLTPARFEAHPLHEASVSKMAAGLLQPSSWTTFRFSKSVSKRWLPAYSSGMEGDLRQRGECIEAMAAGLPSGQQRGLQDNRVYRSDGC